MKTDDGLNKPPMSCFFVLYYFLCYLHYCCTLHPNFLLHSGRGGGGGRHGRGPTVKIFIGNIAEGTVTADVQQLFADFGEVVEADVLTGFGFVVSLL